MLTCKILELKGQIPEVKWNALWEDYRKFVEKKNKKINQLEEKEELHLNRIDELTDRVVKLETNRDEVIEHCHKRLGFLENCVGGDEELIHTRISVHREYLKILERGKE